MQLPPLPLVPIDLDREETEFLTSLDGKIDGILVAGRERNQLQVLGNRGGHLSFLENYDYVNTYNVRDYVVINRENDTGKIDVCSFPGPDYKTWKDEVAFLLTVGLYTAYQRFISTTQRRKRIIQKAFNSKALFFRDQNLANIAERIKPIRLYQGTMEEVERDLGRPLERVDTGKPETYIQKKDPFWLRVEAYLLGANAVAHYQPGSAIGTPVRFKEK